MKGLLAEKEALRVSLLSTLQKEGGGTVSGLYQKPHGMTGENGFRGLSGNPAVPCSLERFDGDPALFRRNPRQ